MPEQQEMPDNSRDADALRAAFGREGCPMCTVTLESMDRVMDGWNYEGFTDVEHRFELIRSRGFCPLHTWQLAKRNNAFQLAVIYREILTDILPKLGNGEPARKERQSWGVQLAKRFGKSPSPIEIVPNYDLCPLCLRRADIEERLTTTLLNMIASEETRTQLSQSTGLCLPHFEYVYSRAQAADPQRASDALACQRVCMQRVLDDVGELARKHDYRFLDEQRGDEMTSWRRAAALFTGNAGVR